MWARIAFFLCLSLLHVTAFAQPRSTVSIFVPRSVQQVTLNFTLENNSGVSIAPGAVRSTQHYNIHDYIVTWPFQGRQRRDDFVLFAKVSSDPERPFYLRLRPGQQPVHIYVFNAHYSRCAWTTPRPAQSPEDIYRALAQAEGMLRILSPNGRCSAENLRNWTLRWAELINQLWDQTDGIRLDRRVIQAIRQAHDDPPRTGLFSFNVKPIPYPAEFRRLLQREQQLASKFN
jgi:hypothetical protein